MLPLVVDNITMCRMTKIVHLLRECAILLPLLLQMSFFNPSLVLEVWFSVSIVMAFITMSCKVSTMFYWLTVYFSLVHRHASRRCNNHLRLLWLFPSSGVAGIFWSSLFHFVLSITFSTFSPHFPYCYYTSFPLVFCLLSISFLIPTHPTFFVACALLPSSSHVDHCSQKKHVNIVRHAHADS